MHYPEWKHTERVVEVTLTTASVNGVSMRVRVIVIPQSTIFARRAFNFQDFVAAAYFDRLSRAPLSALEVCLSLSLHVALMT